MSKRNLLDAEVIDHIAILFSSLSMNERGQLLSLTHEELSSMLHSEQSHFLGVFQAHIQEWIDKGNASGIFSYGKVEKIQPCLDFVSSLIKKLMSKEADLPLKLTTKEADVVLSYFNSTEMIFRSDCRMHSEEEVGCMTEKEVLIILKEIETIDALYKTGMKSIVKIQLSAGHFLKEALNIQKAMQERASKGFLNYLEREESEKAIALNQAAKSQRLQEIEQYQVILNHLRNQREERTNLLELQQCPLPPFPILKEEEIRDIIGIFSPLVEEFKEYESSLLQEIFEKTLREKASEEERCVYARAVLDHNINEIHIAEEHVRNKQPEGSFSQDSDAQILSLYKKYISGEIDLFILSFAQKKRELYLSSIKKLHISLSEVI
jgi:hypothetical protein